MPTICRPALYRFIASVWEQFNTTTSMGRLALNILLSFAQFEREVIGDRIRDTIVASEPG
jgi:site-specific DNA recombinase